MDAQDRSHRRAVWLIVVIIAALGLGYVGFEATVVWHRGAMRERIKASGGRVDRASSSQIESKSDIPWIRRILGDELIDRITLRQDSPTDVIERSEVAAEFAEATVVVLLRYITP